MKLFIGIPSYTGITMQFAASMLTLARKKDLDLSLHMGVCYIGKGRNELALDFLNSDCDKFLQIDNDILFNVADVERISSHDLPIVGGCYYKKEANRVVVAEALDMGSRTADPESGLLHVKYMGTGFLCVKREVFVNMRAKWRDEDWFWYRDETTEQIRFDFFPHGVHRGLHRWLGEDWFFCERANELGYKVYADTKCTLRHIGSAIYPLEDSAKLREELRLADATIKELESFIRDIQRQ